MKLNVSVVFLFFVSFFQVYGQDAEDVKIKGKVTNYRSEKVTLFNVKGGSLNLISSQHVPGDSTFAFTISDASDGFYYLGLNDAWHSAFVKIYVTKGSQAEVRINGYESDVSNVSNEAQQLIMNKWSRLLDAFRSDFQKCSTNIDSLYLVISEYTEKAKQFKTQINTNDATFNQLMGWTVDADMDDFLLSKHNMALHYTPEMLEKHPVYIALAEKTFDSSMYLCLGNGMRVLSLYKSYKYGLYRKLIADHFKFGMNLFDNNTLKGQILVDYFHQRNITGRDFSMMMDTYGKYIVTDYQKELIREYKKAKGKFEEGMESLDFKYADVNEKMHALSDYRGHVVLVDVWATWCAPCKAEIPHLEQLVEHFKNDDVVFISVSVDKDQAKWEQFVKEKEMKGVQLIADKAFKSKIVSDYVINGVPRFMLFDKEGKIVSVNAARPSNPRLKKMIEEQLTPHP
jgi:thiol-disulfide isomerase/thioredoxin